jgi:hypothetical protein
VVAAYTSVGPSSSGARSTTSPLTWTHNCPAGTTELLAAVAIDTGTPTSNPITAATYNNLALSSIGSRISGGSAQSSGYLALYHMFNPPTGTAFTFSFTISGTLDDNSGGSLTFSGSSSLSAPTFADSNAANVTTATINVPTTSANNLVAAFQCDGSTQISPPNFQSPATERFNQVNAGGSAAGALAGATQAATGGTIAVKWNQPSDFYAFIAVEVQASGGGPVGRPQKVRTVYGNPAHLVGTHQVVQLTSAAFR